IDTGFFQLGGQSLTAMYMAGKIHKTFNVRLTLQEVFRAPRIRELAQLIKNMPEARYVSLQPVEEREYYPLSSAQKRLYIMHRMEPGSIAYNMPHAFELEGHIDIERLEDAIGQLINRHENFRSSFSLWDNEPVQRILPGVAFRVSCFEVKKGENKVGQQVRGIIRDFIKPFRLDRPPLLRTALIKEMEDRCILIFDMHHIISDGGSIGTIAGDFMDLYNGKTLAPLHLRYKDYSQWQHRQREVEAVKTREEYWLKQFDGEVPVLDLPLDYERPPARSFEGRRLHFELSPEVSGALKELASGEEVTLFTLLLTLFSLFLSKITHQEDIVIGTPSAGRNHEDLKTIVGMLVNTLVLRTFPGNHKRIKEFLGETGENTLAAFDNQDYQYEELVEKVAGDRDTRHNPLFDVMMVLQNMGTGKIANPGLKLTPYAYENNTSKFDLMLVAVEGDETIRFTFEYCTKLFKTETILRFINYFQAVVFSLLENMEKSIADIGIISEEEKKQVLEEFNDTAVKYPKDKTVHQLFEEQVERTADHIALAGQTTTKDDASITYGQLNEKSNQLALLLKEKGVFPGTIIGIMVGRCVEMIIGIFGILKAGAAYLPIDPDYPEERVDYMLRDSGAKIIVANGLMVNGFDGLVVKEPDGSSQSTNQPINQPTNKPTNLAYIIYTSGSTGKPKGVAVEHSQLANFVYHMYGQYDGKVDSNDRCLGLTNFIFDVSLWEIFLPLVYGARLVLLPGQEIFDIFALSNAIVREAITLVYIPPSLLKALNRELEQQQPGPVSLNKMLVGVEPIRDEVLEGYMRLNPDMRIINAYGPTETTICATSMLYTSHQPRGEIVPIGAPLSNNQVVLLDAGNHPVPLGIAGEICISGDGVSRGYLNNPELTAEKYTPHPYFEGKRMYRTGDLGRWLEGGNIRFIGRRDQQVKVRGYRVELGEVESSLVKREEVREALVAVREGAEGEKYLVAYVVSDKELKAPDLKEYLSGKLPGYMVPSYFMSLEEIPLTPSGKVDRGALPGPVIEAGESYIAPAGEVERKLVEIWSGVLEIESENISTNGNFFDLGGHSLKAAAMVSRIHKELDVKVTLVEIFRNSTIRALGKIIGNLDKTHYTRIEPAEEMEFYPLSSAQKRLYILQQMDERNIGYNMPQVLELRGLIDRGKLENTFPRLIRRHESLRTSFFMTAGEPVQRVHDANRVTFQIDFYELEEKKARQWLNTFSFPFDLSRPPLMRGTLIKLGDQRHLLAVDMHHIITDGISHGILIRDFIFLYEGEELAPLPIQYKDFSQWQDHGEGGQRLIRREEYWLKRFDRDVPVINLPTDYYRPAVRNFEGGRVSFKVDRNQSAALKELALAEEASVFMVLLAIFNVFLSKLSGIDDIVVGTGKDGREHQGLHQIMGMFVNTLALRNSPRSTQTFRDFLEELKTNTLRDFENQDYPFEDIVENLELIRDTSRNPLFDVMFQFNNFETPGLSIPGLQVMGYPHDQKTSKFDLTLWGWERRENLDFSFEYDSRLFRSETIDIFIRYFKEITAAAVNNPQKQLRLLRRMSPENKEQLLQTVNQNIGAQIKPMAEREQVLQHRLDRSFRKFEYQIAIQYGDHALTYGELDRRSNRVARQIIARGIRKGDFVGILMDDRITLITTVLGIIKAGA
ncbi:MAG: amino acid adenylation domain-containing protein, partial [bacterium]|nr:amino acid adenylation domain-containing protein [bacterium]